MNRLLNLAAPWISRVRTMGSRRWTWWIAVLGLVSLVIDIVYVTARTGGDIEASRIVGTFPITFHAASGDVTTTGRFPGQIFAPQGAERAPLTIEVPIHVPPHDRAWGLLLARPLDAVEARWDGHPLRNVNIAAREGITPPGTSMLALVPDELASPGEHRLQVRLTSAYGMHGLLGDAIAGPFTELRDTLARRELHLLLLMTILHSAAVVWVSIAILRPRRSEFLWGGMLWGALGMHFFTSTEAWSLGNFDLFTRLTVRQSTGAAACLFTVLFAASFAPQPPRAKPWLVAATLVGYLTSMLLAVHESLPLTQLVLIPVAFATMVFGMRWYYLGAKHNNRVAQQLVYANLPAWSWYLYLIVDQPMLIDWMALPALGFFVLSASIILMSHHASLSDRYETLFSRARDAVVVAGRDGSIRDANAEAQAIFRLHPGSPRLLDVHTSPAVRTHLAAGPDGRRSDLTFPTDTGSTRIVESVAVDIDDDEVLLIARDVTGRANAERSLVHASRMETVGVVAGGMVHDLNNALGRILAHVDALKQDAPTTEQARLDGMAEDILRASRTARQVATLVRERDTATVTTEEAGAIVRDTAKWIARGGAKGVQLDLAIAPNLPAVRARRTDLEQVVVNLVGNAIHASPPLGKVCVSAVQTGSGLEITVEDEGGGVPADLRSRVWEPFFTTRADGTGIGLAVVARIARDLGGYVALEDGARGARFRVVLPTAATSAQPRPRIRLMAHAPERRERLRAMLEERGFEVAIADRHDAAGEGLMVVDGVGSAKTELPQAHASVLWVRAADAPHHESAVNEPLDAEKFAAAVRRALFAST